MSTPAPTERDTLKLVAQQRAAIQLLERTLHQKCVDHDKLFAVMMGLLKHSGGKLQVPRAVLDGMLLECHRLQIRDEGDTVTVELLALNDPLSN